MKNSILLIAGFLTIISISGQNYFPLVQENNEWTTLIVIQSGPYPWDTTFWTDNYRLSGDTVINNQTYTKLYKSQEEFPINWNYCAGLREENQKVWRNGTNNYPEMLIYDFTLNLGDTINLWDDDPMIVDSIVNKPINNENRKHIYFSYPGYPSLSELWIEGIGSNRGILEPGSGTFEGGSSWLLCMKENGAIIYSNPNYNSCFLITKIEEINNSLIEAYPNPAEDLIKISNLENIRIESISLFDLSGQKIRDFDKSKTELDLSRISTGIYLLKLSYANSEIIRKIIIR
jgi:hypothetical protein